MEKWIDAILVAIIFMDLLLIAYSNLSTCIRTVAFQGIVVGILPLIMSEHLMSRGIILAVVAIVLKGMVFPWLLFRALRDSNVRREVEPLIGYSSSILIGIVVLTISVWLGFKLPMPQPVFSTFFLPVAFTTVFIGLFVIITRIKAITQVLGYLVLENGIYIFGVAIMLEQPVMVELGILLDIFVAVFVMGIMIFHISREFDHIDVLRLSQLGEWIGQNNKDVK